MQILAFFSKSWKSRFLKKGGVPPVGSVRGGTPPKSAALSNVWIGASNVKSDMVPIRNTTRKKKSEIWGVRINPDFSRTFGYFRHDFDDFRKKWNFEKSEKVRFSWFFYKKIISKKAKKLAKAGLEPTTPQWRSFRRQTLYPLGHKIMSQ